MITRCTLAEQKLNLNDRKVISMKKVIAYNSACSSIKISLLFLFVTTAIIALMFTSCADHTLKDNQNSLFPGNSNATDTQADTQSNRQKTTFDDDILREYGGDFHNDRFNDICPIKYNDIITIFDTEILLYPTFVDQNEAITNLAAKMSDLLEVLAQERNLAPLSDDNWEEYNTAVNVHMDSPDYNSENDYSKVRYLLGFFDIYENKACNDEIRQVLASYDNADERLKVKNSLPSGIPEKDQQDFVSAFILCDIRALLPYYSTQTFDDIPEVQRLLGTYEPNMSGREIKEYLLNKMEELK